MSRAHLRYRTRFFAGAATAVLALLAIGSSMSAPAQAKPAPAPSSYADSCGDPLPKSGGGTWTCSFADDFGGTRLNTSKWITQDSARSGFAMGGSCFSGDRNVKVRGGYLSLSVTKAAAPFECTTPNSSFTTEYTGADIATWGRFSQTYGRFEARLKYPAGSTAGLHGGFWMNPQKWTYGAWPNSGEIDVAEWWSYKPDRAFPSLVYPGWGDADTGKTCSIGRADVFHTYAVEWNATQMSFIYDGNVCFTRSWMPNAPLVAPQPFDHPFYLSLSFASDWWRDAATAYPATMTVDYVKAWR